ncbi:MAG: choice-of-anchor D domain-containing protein [Deltaproteobacteria bacterium]|nr:choice-of-anchor D domain-containing protein [Deltaproteobacteria bacterium]
MIRGVGAVVVAVGAACSGDELGRAQPDLRVCASAADTVCASPISLGALKTAQTHQVAVSLRNAGTGVLHVHGAEVVAGDGVVVGEWPTAVAAHADLPLPLGVTPMLDGPATARLSVTSDDPDTPRLEVEVALRGISPGLVVCPGDGVVSTPAECASSLAVDLGEVRPTQTRDVVLLVRNTGNASLGISGATITDGCSVAGELSIVTSTAAGGLAAGAESLMVIRYHPEDGLPDNVSVVITPEETNVAPATVVVSASTPDNEAPVAQAVELASGLAVATGQVGLGLWLDGRGSSDPEGDPLLFLWSVVVAPSGSGAQPESAAAKLTRFVPDRLGAYTIQLQVADSLDLIGVAEVSVTVAPRYSLLVAADWGVDAGDVDLHLVPDGDLLFGPSDCYFGQPRVDWGLAADTRDDPVLRADDVSGNGREQIAVARLADGRYAVWVQYFDSQGGLPADVTVRVATDDGQTALGEAAVTLAQTCDAFLAGVVDWPARTFIASGAALDSQCGGGTP